MVANSVRHMTKTGGNAELDDGAQIGLARDERFAGTFSHGLGEAAEGPARKAKKKRILVPASRISLALRSQK